MKDNSSNINRTIRIKITILNILCLIEPTRRLNLFMEVILNSLLNKLLVRKFTKLNIGKNIYLQPMQNQLLIRLFNLNMWEGHMADILSHQNF